jgi:hypothetical protein
VGDEREERESFDRVGEDRGWRRDPLYRGDGEGVLEQLQQLLYPLPNKKIVI